MPSSPSDPVVVYSVSELNRTVGDVLGASFPLLWVEGELSNVARPRSGHVYFSLKDSAAQVRCALFRSKARLTRARIEDGSEVRVRARVGLYAARGDYQLIVEHIEHAGDGALRRAFDALKHKLDAEGLFAESAKRALPSAPRRIGLITSATGAAVRDALRVLARRYPLAAARVYPVPVQGPDSAATIAAALASAGRRGDCDVLLLIRGGGALEDLAAFNDERVARAMARCETPIITGVGHEVDVTIADLVADRRGATPTAAAESACPEQTVERQRLAELVRRLGESAKRGVAERRARFEPVGRRLARQHPRRRLEAPMQRIDDAEQRLQRALKARLQQRVSARRALGQRLQRAAPTRRLARERARLSDQRRRLRGAEARQRRALGQRLDTLARALHGVSPLATLARGYAIARDADGAIVRRADAVRIGSRVHVTLAAGRLDCDVVAVDELESAPHRP